MTAERSREEGVSEGRQGSVPFKLGIVSLSDLDIVGLDGGVAVDGQVDVT
jgi:hypothetical protein